MKYILSTLLFISLLFASGVSEAARTGPVEMQMLPASCSVANGGIVNYNSTTGVFSCVTVTGQAYTWTATQTFSTIGGYLANTTSQSGTTYTLSSTDCGTKIIFTNASAITVTLPKTLAVGCEVTLEQFGASKVSVTPASGATINSPHSYTGTYAQYSQIAVSVDTNVGGTAAIWSFIGDGS